ncbi:dienelactone hydrolase [Agriterribacter sp.]|uniref:alpha/beta hydrolase family protein n=1 Tax=Agriterribacter sp. TaxID=2821509 RepID=UPI002BC2E5EC|nr:dienelactone hydrolase [Agriterribacter sp.]HRO44465.1 dienelactone hydrolase [Agriterribacter sp.]HRQ16509.1 dienelactone hydrolase [Agriterribacter sp.]
MKPTRLLIISLCFLITAPAKAQTIAESFINGDALPDAPELAARGPYKAGVRTLTLINKDQADILHSKGGVDPLYNRPLKLEIWYPAIVPEGKTMLAVYEDILGSSNDSLRPIVPFTFKGRALRDAVPDKEAAAFPLVIVSHGYPGSRVLLSYLTENLASKGYVVVAIDHTESTHAETKGFQSTLLNRAKDIRFVLNQIAALAKSDSGSFLAGLADAGNTALIGYSMGGYGVLNVAGAGYSEKLAGFFTAITNGSKAINTLLANNADFKTSFDPGVKAVVAFAPWGMQRGVWDEEGLKGLKIPVFFVAGNKDDVSGYEDGIKAIYDGAINASRYLLTYENARHNVAPNPPPPESLQAGLAMQEYYHYAEPAWNERRINNINQHFITAFLDVHLKKKDLGKYLMVNESPAAQTWPGFKPRTSVGLQLLHASPGN